MPDRPRRPRREAGATRIPGRSPELPEGPLEIDTGTVELRRDPARPTSVTVLVNGVPSSHHDLADATYLEFEYMQHMAAIIEDRTDGPMRAVHLGAAACTLPRWLDAVRPGSRQIAVDVDGRLLAYVRDWFDLPRSPHLRLRQGEARAVLSRMPDASADVVVRDVFAGDATPAPLRTTAFLAEVRRVLRPGGLYLANCADRPPLTVARAEVATALRSMDEVGLVAEPGQLRGRRYGNLVIVARSTAGPERQADENPRGGTLDDPGLERRLRSLPVPARLLLGEEVAHFAGSTPPLADTPEGPATSEEQAEAAPGSDAASA